MSTGEFTIGVEEEFLVVDAVSGALRPDGRTLLPAARDRLGEDVHPELHGSQLETNTPVAETLADVRTALTRLRSVLASTVAAAGWRRPAPVPSPPGPRTRRSARSTRWWNGSTSSWPGSR